MANAKKIKEIPNKIKEIKELKSGESEESKLEEELEQEESERFAQFMRTGSSIPVMSNGQEQVEGIENIPSNVSMPSRQEIEAAESGSFLAEERSVVRLYDMGRHGTDQSHPAYVSNVLTSTPQRMHREEVGRDFAERTIQSSLPESGNSELLNQDLNAPENQPKYSASRKALYPWEEEK